MLNHRPSEMITELDDLLDHLERYRGVTLQTLELLDDDELGWRATPEQFSIGQHLLHIAQAEDLYANGLFRGDWNYDRVRFPEVMPSKADIAEFFQGVRSRTTAHLSELAPDRLGEVVTIPGSDIRLSLRSWLWFLVEHEMHHKAQAAVYLRLMGRTPPFYAMPMPEGERPDIEARRQLGGF